MIRLDSARLRYVRLTEDDFYNFAILEQDPEVMKFYTRKLSVTMDDSRVYFDKYMNYMSVNPDYGGFAVFLKDTGEFIGISVIIHIELQNENKDVEIGYRLHTNFWGQGYATEMARTMMEYGFNVRGHKELFGTTNPDHKVSQHILKKVGMVEIGPSTHYQGSTLFKISV